MDTGGEEAAVEAAQIGAQAGGEAAFVHSAPHITDQWDEGGEIGAAGFQQLGKGGGAGQQADGLGEHAEDAAHEEGGDGFRGMGAGFQFLCQAGQQGGDITGDGDAMARWVQA